MNFRNKFGKINDIITDSKLRTNNILKPNNKFLYGQTGFFLLPRLSTLITFFFFSFQGATQTYIYIQVLVAIQFPLEFIISV